MVASTNDSSSNGTNPRGRRRVSRVNYAEDLSFDDGMAFSTELNATVSAGKLASEKTPPVIGKSATSVPQRDLLNGSTGMNVDSVPLNWQPKQPANALLNILDFTNAVVKADGILYLRDGTTFSPEGTLLPWCGSTLHWLTKNFTFFSLSNRAYLLDRRTPWRALLHCKNHGVRLQTRGGNWSHICFRR